MAGRMLCWLMVATALYMCREGVDSRTWPGCPVKIPHVERGKFDQEVTWLNWEHCNITSLTPNELVYPKITRLDLNDNDIEMIENGLFDSLVSLEYVYLYNNKLLGKYLPSSLFRKNRSIRRIDLSNNVMSDAPGDLLQGLNSLTGLYCNNCYLREIPPFITSVKLPIDLLSLIQNQLTRLDNPAIFVNISNLEFLELQYNKIVYLHVDLLQPLINLSRINLAHNKIRRIPDQLFQNKSRLQNINLAYNRIDYIAEDLFGATRLNVLDLSHNRLLYLSVNILSVLREGNWGAPQFYFTGNMFPCPCLNELLVKLKQLNIYYSSSRYNGKHKNCIMLDSFKCHGLGTYRQYFLKHCNENK